MNVIGRGLLLLALQAAIHGWAAETGTMLKADAMRLEPFGDAKTVATLATGTKVEILKKDGGWLQVKSGPRKGWVRMLSVRTGSSARTATGLLALTSGRAGTGKVVATTGIRGLNEEELRTAQFNAAELALAESYATTPADARAFATQGKLVARPFGHLPAPQ